jgi:hypothetical protein
VNCRFVFRLDRKDCSSRTRSDFDAVLLNMFIEVACLVERVHLWNGRGGSREQVRSSKGTTEFRATVRNHGGRGRGHRGGLQRRLPVSYTAFEGTRDEVTARLIVRRVPDLKKTAG